MSQRKANYDSAIRMIKMVRLLESRATRRMSVKAMSERIGVSTKTIDRYVSVLSESLTTEHGETFLVRERCSGEAWLCLAREKSRSAVNMFYRYAAIWASSRWLLSGNGTVLGDMAEAQLDDLAEHFPGPQARLLERLPTAFHYVAFGPKDYRVNEEVLEDLIHAVIYRRPVEVERLSRSGDVARNRLEPYTLVMYRDGLYLLARLDGDQGPHFRTYALERFVSVDVIKGEELEIPDEFDPARHFEGRLGLWEPTDEPARIELAFTAGAAEVLAARRWPGFVGWSDTADGRRILELDLPLNVELVSWIVSWGPQVQVLGPESLRRWVVEELRSALAAYTDEQ